MGMPLHDYKVEIPYYYNGRNQTLMLFPDLPINYLVTHTITWTDNSEDSLVIVTMQGAQDFVTSDHVKIKEGCEDLFDKKVIAKAINQVVKFHTR